MPKQVIVADKLNLNQPLEVTIRGRSIVLTPLPERPSVSLESLLHGVTPDTVGGEADWGGDQGAEHYE
jgi:antitoxin component of MazEF toxin-antitoxin module